MGHEIYIYIYNGDIGSQKDPLLSLSDKVTLIFASAKWNLQAMIQPAIPDSKVEPKLCW